MSISQVKALSWLTAIGLTAMLGWYVFDFVTQLDARRKLFDEDLAKQTLDNVQKPEVQEFDLVAVDSVEHAFYDLNWTGEPPPPPPVVDELPQDDGPKYVPVATLVKVLFILHDENRPERSSAFIRYLDAAGVQGAAAGAGATQVAGVFLGVGDSLAEPHAAVHVHSISGDGVTFAFEDEEREHETLSTPEFDPNTVIVQTTEDGIIRAPKTDIRRISPSAAWEYQKRTTQVGKDHYAIGLEDQLDLADDFATILAREVRHRRHRDPRTGKYDGIELTEVKPGGFAARHGAETGDVIKSINGHPVASSAEAINFVKNNEDKYSTWLVVVENKGKERTVKYETPPEE